MTNSPIKNEQLYHNCSHWIARLSIALLFLAIAGIAPAVAQDNQALMTLADEFDVWRKEGAEGWIEASALAVMERRHAQLKRIQVSLLDINSASLTNDQLILCEVLEHLIAEDVGRHEFGQHLIPFGPSWGADRRLAEFGTHRTVWSDDELAEYLDELRSYPKWLQNIQLRMRKGLEEGITPPGVTIRELPERLAAFLNPNGLDNLIEPFRRRSLHIDADRVDTLWTDFNSNILPALLIAIRSFHEFVREEYLPQCRDSIAASALPRGAEYYEFTLRIFAETDRSPRELHEIGLSEVQRLHAQAVQMIPHIGILPDNPDTDTTSRSEYFRAAVEHLTTSPSFRFAESEELLRSARDISKKVDAWLPSLFADLPRLPCAIMSTPAPKENANAVGYLLGNFEDGVSSFITFNTINMDRHFTWALMPFVLHEGMPGHHLQFALAHEMPMSHRFRQDAWFAGFGEGWAMYAESLGQEMGLYHNPIDEFGRIASELHRACRLVVDPAIHTLGWSREQAIEYMTEHSALPHSSIVVDVDRIIAYPGHVCSYTVNGLRLMELRKKAENALGARFDIRVFHDAILSAGSVPIAVADRRVNEWIDDVRGESQETP